MAATPPPPPSGESAALEYMYFPLYAKGLGPALCLSFSGLAWKGPKDLGWDASKWGELKASGEPPFGQMPLLRTPEGPLGQTIAIVHYIAKKAGAVLEGANARENQVSEMLIAEAEDIWSMVGKVCPTMYADFSTKPGYAAYDKFWAESLPAHLAKLEALCTAAKGFSASGATAGELQLFGYLYQCSLVKADFLASAPKVAAWFATLAADERVQSVVTGESSYGPMTQYVIAAPPQPTMEFLYFPLFAKGFGPALCLTFSGLPWKGPKDLGWDSSTWPELKSSGECPFGQLPLLRTGGPAGKLGQTLAIVNYIARTAGPKLEGESAREVAVSQMLLSEAEDVWSAMNKFLPTLYAKEKLGADAEATFWAEGLPAHLAKLEALCTAAKGFSASGATAGELQLFGYLYQCSLVKADFLASAPNVAAWFATLAADERVKSVVAGESSFGTLNQYIVGY